MTTLGELTARGSLIVGDGYRTKTSELGPTGFPILRVAEVGDGFIRPTFEDHVRGEFEPKIGIKRSKVNDVLLTTKGTVGRRAIMPPHDVPFAYSPQLCFFRVLDSSIDYRWLYYWLGSAEFWRQAGGVSTQTDMAPYISLRDLRQIEVSVPHLLEQRAIAATLGALDDKIESNRRATQLLEDLGESILASGLHMDAYGFPLYGPTTLGQHLDVLETGSRPRGGAKLSGSGTVSLGAENIQSAGVMNATKLKTVPTDYAEAMKRGRLQEMDVLVYKDGGTPGNFTPHVSAFGRGFPTRSATINEHVYRVRSTELGQALLYWILRSPWMDQEMRKRGTGVAIPGLNSSNFKDLPMPAISAANVSRLNQQLTPLLELALQLGTQSQRLADLRDTLLPELLSGRIHVTEAREAVEITAGSGVIES